ncbi:hypothetical protein [Campylobacter sp. 2014D-0216]|uniref:hypothetical protein n=1 Tax=Campylobacter sp. 2014D-0216 TaxID=1813595 RepID=UPI0018A452F9|nr:hypothetical protein [Campylobacter sp. 2014D-0216]QOR01924.1 hypothetical protein A0083_04120 [Campylobacter sp. 2014D-0216]
MEKPFLYLKKIFDDLENILFALSKRELILAFIMVFLLGFFLVYISVYSTFEVRLQSSQNELFELKSQYQQIQDLIAIHDEKIEFLDENLSLEESKDYQSVLKHIEQSLSQIQAKELQIQSHKVQDKYFAYYEVRLNFKSDFYSLMQFLQNLDPYVKVRQMELVKDKNDLKIILNLVFTLV